MQHFLDDHTLANGVTIPPLDAKTHGAEQDCMEEEEALVSEKINTCDSPSKTDKMILEETQNPKTFQSDVNHSDEPSVSENKKDLHSVQSTDIPTESNQPPLSTNPLEESVQAQISDNFPIENEEQVPFDQTSSPPNPLKDEGPEKTIENTLQEKLQENQETNLPMEIESKKNNTKNSLKKGSLEIHESPNPKKKYNRKATHSKYNELVSFIDCLSKFNWSKNYVSGQKISAAKYYTPNVYWFLINAEYFPRNTFAHKNNKDSIHNRLYRLKGFTPDIPQRLTRLDLKSEVIHVKPVVEASEHMHLSSFSKAIRHSTETIRANNLAASRTINHVHRPNYTMEDDEWMIEMRRFIYENYTALHENNDSKPENFDLLSKIDLQDLILLYEKDLYGIASHNEKEIDAIETKISDLIQQEEPLRKLNHDLQDSLVDFKMKFPEEEAFISYLEKKQNEAKETAKPAQPMPNESHASKGGKKGPGSMSRKTNVKVKLEDAICQICNDADYSDDDLIVFCAKCNIGVHQQCYGIPVLPDGDWICDVCLTFQDKGKYLRCPFCDKRGGAMKPTCTRVDTDLFEFSNPEFDAFLKSYCHTDSVKAFPKIKPPSLYINKAKNKSGVAAHHDDEDEEQDLYYDFELLDEHFTEEELKDEPKPPYIWAHISCVLFIPELYFGDDIYASNILGLENINKDRFKYECSICEKRKNGAIVNCERNSCKKAFHPECARRAQTFLEIRENENNQFIYHIYCEKHTPLKLKRTIESLENKMKDEIQKFFNAIDKQYAAYLQESKPSRPELHASNTALTKEQILQEENLKRKKLLSIREEGNYFLKLIDKYITQHKNQPLSITLQSVPSADGVDKFEIFDINIPKATHRAKTKLSFDDEIWRNMPYKNLTPEQKYQKYSKLHAEMKKKQKLKLLKLKSTHKATSGGRTQENRNQSGRRLRDRESEKPQTHVTQLPQKKIKKGKVDNEEKSDILYCICRKTYDGKLMIDCEQCENWYHPKCVGLPKNTNWKKLKYTCKSCTEKNLAAGVLVQSVLNKRSLELESANNNKKSLPSKKLKKQ